jgi:hypothetical protein
MLVRDMARPTIGRMPPSARAYVQVLDTSSLTRPATRSARSSQGVSASAVSGLSVRLYIRQYKVNTTSVQANEKLAEQVAAGADVIVENVADEEAPHIEMVVFCYVAVHC